MPYEPGSEDYEYDAHRQRQVDEEDDARRQQEDDERRQQEEQSNPKETIA